MINILTDSTSDLSNELSQRYNIRVIPLYVLLKEKSFLDGIEINNADLFRFVTETGQLPKTSATPVADFVKVFETPGDHIYIGVSSQLSATTQNALLAQAAVESKKIFIIDSLNLSTGIGMLAIRAAELRDSGCSAAEIFTQIITLVPKVRTSFVIETLNYLYKGGRCSALQNVVSSLLSIRPVIQVRPDGTLGVKSKIRGSRHKALQSMLDDFAANREQINLHRVFITHTGCHADAAWMKQELHKLAPIGEVCITIAGSVVASHCGPDTIGILYLLNL